MNGRQAKRLRRNIRQATVGKPWAFPIRKTNTNALGQPHGIRIEHSLVSGHALYKRAKRESLHDIPH